MFPISSPLSGRNGGTVRASGGQTWVARPIRPTNSPTVTTSETLTGPSPRPRVTNRCTNQPVPGATTPSTRNSESHSGIPWRWLKSQKMKAMTMPNAPWAMLNTRVVV